MATVKAFIRVSKKKIKIANIRFRLSDGRNVQLFHQSEITIDPNHWDESKEAVKAKVIFENRDDFNNSIIERKKIILQAYNKSFNKEGLTSDWLESEIDKILHPKIQEPIEEAKPSFFTQWDEFIEKRRLSEVRIRNYDVVNRALLRYELYKAKSTGVPFSLELDTVTADTLRDLEIFLRSEHEIVKLHPEIYKNVKKSKTKVEPRGTNTISGMMIKIRTFFIWANDEGLTTNNPFKKFKIESAIYGTPYYISIEERNQLYAKDLSQKPSLAIQRDIFVFQCVIGCRVQDLLKFTKANFINGAIEYIPRKTKEGNPVTVRVPVNTFAKEIIDRYAAHDEVKLLPFISEQKYNDAIKEAFTEAELTREVTIINPTTREEDHQPLNKIASSHLARRCFIGNLYKQVQDPNMIGKLSGHAEGSKAFARYRNVDEQMKKDLVKMLE